MTRRRYLFDTPDRFVAGTVGEPGNRTFFLQARDGSRVISVALEKVQIAALIQRLASCSMSWSDAASRAPGPSKRSTPTGPARRAAQRGLPCGFAVAGLGRRADALVMLEAREHEADEEASEERSEAEDDDGGRARPAARPVHGRYAAASSSPARSACSPRAARRARCAASRSTRRATSARGATATS